MSAFLDFAQQQVKTTTPITQTPPQNGSTFLNFAQKKAPITMPANVAGPLAPGEVSANGFPTQIPAPVKQNFMQKLNGVTKDIGTGLITAFGGAGGAALNKATQVQPNANIKNLLPGLLNPKTYTQTLKDLGNVILGLGGAAYSDATFIPQAIANTAVGFTKEAIGNTVDLFTGQNKAHSALTAGVDAAMNNPDKVQGATDLVQHVLTQIAPYLIAGQGVQDLPNNTETIPGLKTTTDTMAKTANTVKQTVSPTLSPQEAVGQVIQGKTENVPAAERTLSNIDTTGVKTYKDLQAKINSYIKSESAAQDAKLSADPRTFKIQQLATKVGDTTAAHNYVIDAVNQLKDYFTKTNDIANLQKVDALKAKIDPTTGKGLTLKEVNDIARMHGTKLNGFNANGELASGLTKQAAENTRMGLKMTIRNLLLDNSSKLIDANISDAYDTKALIDKQVEKTNTATQKTPKQGIVPKLVSKGIKVADYVTGSPLKAIGKELGTAGGSGTLSPTEIEGRLAKNLKIIRKTKQ